MTNTDNRKKWVLVSNPGTDEEKELASFYHFDEAKNAKFCKRYTDGMDCDVMKRNPDGTLTTEY